MQQVDISEREEKYEAVASSVAHYVRIATSILWGMIRLVYGFVLWLFLILFEILAVIFLFAESLVDMQRLESELEH